MPQPPPFANFPGEIIEHRAFDNGDVISVVSYSKVMETRDGVQSIVTRADSILTVDGLLYNHTYATKQDPLLLAVCHRCRHPRVGPFLFREKPSHGLCTLPNARQCQSCGITVCPRHSETRQGKALCCSCAKRRRLWKLIKPLFFRRVEE